jgi:DNA-binding MarR family transcriptional regulator
MMEVLAETVMEAASMVTRTIKREVRRHRPADVSMPQFRTLGVLQHHPGASLSVVAQHLGSTTASASKLIDALVRLGFVTRADAPEDRRKVVLNLTEAGERAREAAREAALGHLAELLMRLNDGDRQSVVRAMDALRAVLTEEVENGG